MSDAHRPCRRVWIPAPTRTTCCTLRPSRSGSGALAAKQSDAKMQQVLDESRGVCGLAYQRTATAMAGGPSRRTSGQRRRRRHPGRQQRQRGGAGGGSRRGGVVVVVVVVAAAAAAAEQVPRCGTGAMTARFEDEARFVMSDKHSFASRPWRRT